MMSTGTSYDVRSTEVRWPIMSVLALPLLMACGAIYLFRLTGDETSVAAGLILLVSGLLSSTAVVLFAEQVEVAMAASSVVLIQALALVTVLLPGSGSVLVDTALLLAVTTGALLMYHRSVHLPGLGTPSLRLRSVLMVLILPMALALLQALFLGYRFWENYQVGRYTLLMIPMMAIWGFLEELLFRGITLRSTLPLLGRRRALLLSASLGAIFMLFWGSLPFAIFSLFLGIILGALYLRSRSLMYVGTVHALTDTWMVVALLVLGIV